MRCARRLLVVYPACRVVRVRVAWWRVVFRVPCLLSVLVRRVVRVVFVVCCASCCSALVIVHCVLCDVYCIMQYYVLCIGFCILCTAYCVRYTPYCILCTVHCIVYSILCSVFSCWRKLGASSTQGRRKMVCFFVVGSLHPVRFLVELLF